MDTALRFTTILAVSLSASFCDLRTARAEDVYNFYFQKAPGPQTVTQGSGPSPILGQDAQTHGKTGSSWDAGATDSTRSQTSLGLLTKHREPDSARWWIGLGSAVTGNAGLGETGYLSADYRFSKYLGLNALVMLTGKDALGRYQNIGDLNAWERLDSSFGFVVTPIHTDLFGWNWLELSLTAGVATAQRKPQWIQSEIYTVRIDPDFGTTYENVETGYRFRRGRELRAYWGGSLDINMSKDLSMRYEGRRLESSRLWQSYLALIWKI